MIYALGQPGRALSYLLTSPIPSPFNRLKTLCFFGYVAKATPSKMLFLRWLFDASDLRGLLSVHINPLLEVNPSRGQYNVFAEIWDSP